MAPEIAFSFHYLPEEDRLVLSFSKKGGEAPAPVQLSRRLVKLLGNALRRYIEEQSTLPETVCPEDRDEMFQFLHMSELESNPPTWSSGQPAGGKRQDLHSAKLVTKLDIQYMDQSVRLLFYRQKSRLVSLSLGWPSLHSFLYSLAEMSAKADWNLEGVFEWSGQTLSRQVQDRRH